jgi:hypothetical protein
VPKAAYDVENSRKLIRRSGVAASHQSALAECAVDQLDYVVVAFQQFRDVVDVQWGLIVKTFG